jgi:enoyl-[acyl-carrier protein] reductase I
MPVLGQVGLVIIPSMVLAGKKGLVLNVTNKNSIGWAVAEMAAREGAEVGVGAQNERMAERVAELVAGVPNTSVVTVDFSDDAQLEALAATVRERFGKIDFLVHSAAFAKREDLTGRFMETSRDGFAMAMDISAYSLVACCKALEECFNEDASVVTMSYLGSTRAVGNYNVMGVAKAALEACVRYLAVDLGPRGIRVNTVSPGPINTVAARGVKGLTDMIHYVHDRAPLKREFGQNEVAGTTVYLLSDLSRGVSGQIIFVDNGYNTVGM